MFLLFSQSLAAIGSIHLSIEQLLFSTLTDTAVPDAADDSNADSNISSIKKNSTLYHLLQFDQITVELDISSTPISFKLNLAKIKLPQPFKKFTSAKLSCYSFSIKNNRFSCAEGIIDTKGLFSHPPQNEASTAAKFSFEYDLLSDKFFLTIEDLMIGSGKVSLKLQLVNNSWVADIDAKGLDYQHIKHYMNYYIADQIKDFEDIGGKVRFSAKLSGYLPTDNYTDQNSDAEVFKLESIDLNGEFQKVHYSYNDNLAENLGFKFKLKKQPASKTINSTDKIVNTKSSSSYPIIFSIQKPVGEIYQNDVYIVFKGNETLQLNLNYQPVEQIISLHKIKLDLPDILDFNSHGMISFYLADGSHPADGSSAVNKFKAVLNVHSLRLLDDIYLKNILEGTDYEGLNVKGELDIELEQKNKLIHAASKMNKLSLEFKDQFSFIDLNGSLFWNNETNGSVPESQISWQHATLNNLPIGKTLLSFTTSNDQFSLSRELKIALFDGSLNINRLDIENIGHTADADKKLSLTVDGMINPISLSLVSEHFNWPILDGTLSAIIPSTTYTEDNFEIGGAMMLQVFQGVVIIKDLSIEQPLQDYARLQANIDLKNLDLQSLTRTYNFGEIQGKLEGKFSNLVLQSWLPVSFDAYIRTPDNDKSRHRISQRAIDNLSSLGGASGILSRSFLSVFKTFGYNKIGLSCKLKDNICSMSGVEASGKGYYIVKGGGIPRIDVMGFQSRVNWQVLMNRLKSIQSVNEAVIQ